MCSFTNKNGFERVNLYKRFNPLGEGDFADELLSAIRCQFGGHEEKAAATKGRAR